MISSRSLSFLHPSRPWQQHCRHRHHSLFATLTFPDLPGLVIEEDFLSQELQQRVFAEAKCASALANELAEAANQTFVSPAHNIPVRSEYGPVKVPLEGFGGSSRHNYSLSPTPLLSAEHFATYGEGHRLTYYRGNDNIPRLGLPNNLLDQLASRSAIAKEVMESRERLGRGLQNGPNKNYKWRLTLNYYPTTTTTTMTTNQSEQQRTHRAGFPWHRDLQANGAASMIIGLGSPGRLEFGKEPQSSHTKDKNQVVDHPELVEPIQCITLQPGSLLVLTGPARWNYVHRVMNSTDTTTTTAEERASLVYGIW